MNIGFFDSGLGGLTILRAVTKQLPDYNYVFYGDTAHLPYGDKTEEEIYSLTKQGIEYLFQADSALVIVACNTASAETVRRLQREFLPQSYPDRKILGIIIPTIEVLQTQNVSNALLIGTKRTINSNKYQVELDARGNHTIHLTAIATPALVPLIELGETETATKQAIACIESISSTQKIEAVILGCTHYTQLKEALRNHFSSQLLIISQDEVIPDKLHTYLTAHPEITTKLAREGKRTIHLTKHRPDYDTLMGQFLGGSYIDIE